MSSFRYLKSSGSLSGPVSEDDLRELAASGVIGEDTHVLVVESNRFDYLRNVVGVVARSSQSSDGSALTQKRYYYADHSNMPVGPMSLDELQHRQVAGDIHPGTHVIEEGGTTWKPYSSILMQRLSQNAGGVVVPPPPSNSNPQEVTVGMAILWFLVCLPIGFMQWGQTAKGWVWVLISIVTGGVGGIVAIVDYWMCFSIQQRRRLKEWEFFPTK